MLSEAPIMADRPLTIREAYLRGEVRLPRKMRLSEAVLLGCGYPAVRGCFEDRTEKPPALCVLGAAFFGVVGCLPSQNPSHDPLDPFSNPYKAVTVFQFLEIATGVSERDLWQIGQYYDTNDVTRERIADMLREQGR